MIVTETRADVDGAPTPSPARTPARAAPSRLAPWTPPAVSPSLSPGAIGRNDAAVLSTCLHTELDADPAVIVVNLSQVHVCDPAGLEVLTVGPERARAAGVGLHLVDPGAPARADGS